MNKKSFLLPLLLSFSINAQAQNEIDMAADEGQWSWSITATHNSLDTSVEAYGIEDTAFGFGLNFDYTKNNWLTTISTDYLAYDDNQAFSQEVVGTGWANDGDRSKQSSDASGLLIGIASGQMRHFGEKSDVALFIQGGFDFVVRSERSIASCSNCSSQDIDLDGGLFLKAGVSKQLESFSLGFYAKQYLTGDSLGTTLAVSVGSTF